MVCMVVDGTAFRYTIVEPGKRQIMACYIPGDIPDLEGLFLKTMGHSLGVLRSCTIAQIPHDAILRIFEDQPRLGEVFWRETLIDSADGKVHVEAARAADGTLSLQWTETGGPIVKQPERRGFGSRVMDAMIRNQSGEIRFNWRAEGLVCEMTIPTRS